MVAYSFLSGHGTVVYLHHKGSAHIRITVQRSSLELSGQRLWGDTGASGQVFLHVEEVVAKPRLLHCWYYFGSSAAGELALAQEAKLAQQRLAAALELISLVEVHPRHP